MLDDVLTTVLPLPLPVDDEETDRIAAKFAAQLVGGALDPLDGNLKIDRYINAEARARGGMGRVFVAYDPELDRTVAIKALPVGLSPHEPGADTPRREGKALAHLDHPNIVRVLELVEHRGLACLVLEHIDGPHLGDWLKAAPRAWHEVLHKFLQAGEGLAAVHQAGLVHRDVKPANVVVGPRGAVKLIDFGLAVRLGARQPDDPDDRAGTPRYMAPEQIQGREVDARSDQFSFCVALYEALFQAHPYLPIDLSTSVEQGQDDLDASTEWVTRRTIFEQIVHGTVRRPEQLPQGLPSTILPALLRGLSLAPHHRHSSVSDLLTELRRDPRRTRRRILAGVAGGLTFIAGIAGFYCAVRPESCPSLADERTQAWSGLREVVAARLLSFGAGPLASLDSAVDELVMANAAACDARIRGEYRDTDLARDVCLQTRQGELGAVLRQIERSDDDQLARLVDNLPELPTARACADPARLRYSCAEDGTSSSFRAESAAALLAGDFVRAEALAGPALHEAESNGAVGSRAYAQVLLGRIAYDRGDWTRAAHLLTEALDLAEPSACFGAAAEAYYWLVKLAAFDERIPVARAELYSLYQEYRTSDADPAARAAMLNNRALLAERRRGDFPLAESLLRAAIELRRPDYDRTAEQADSYLNLASVLFARGERDPALVALREADERRTAAVGARHPEHAKHLRNLGLIELQRGHHAQAIELLEEARERAEVGLGAEAPGLGEIHLALVQAHDRSGNREAALAAAKAATIAYSRLSPDDLRRSEGMEAVAQMLIAMDRFAEALPLLDAAEPLLKAQNVPTERRGILEFKRAEAFNGLERHTDAERHAHQAIAWFVDAGLPPDHDLRGHAGLILGEALVGQGRWRDAVAPFEQAVAIWHASGANPERLAWARWGLANSLCRLPDRRSEALLAAEEAVRSLSVIEPAGDRHTMQQQLVSICPAR